MSRLAIHNSVTYDLRESPSFFCNIVTILGKGMVTTFPNSNTTILFFHKNDFPSHFIIIYLLHSANCSCSCLEFHQISQIFNFAVYNRKWLTSKQKNPCRDWRIASTLKSQTCSHRYFQFKTKTHSLEQFQNVVKGLSLAFCLLVLKQSTAVMFFVYLIHTFGAKKRLIFNSNLTTEQHFSL